MEKRKTVGEIALGLHGKEPDSYHPKDYSKEHVKSVVKELTKAVEHNKKEFYGDFYIAILTKRERLPGLRDVIRTYYVGLPVCPSPGYDQTVFRYNRANEDLEYLWSLPCPEACTYLRENMNLVSGKERESLQHVIEYDHNILLKTAMILNGEIKLN